MSAGSGERLEIEVDFATQQAVENAQVLVQGIDELAAKTGDAGQAVERAEGGVKEFGESAEQAGAKVKAAGEAAAAAGTGMRGAEGSAGLAAAALEKTARAADHAKDELRDAGAAAEGAAEGGLTETTRAAQAAGRELQGTGRAADAAGKELAGAGQQATTASAGVRGAGQAAADAGQQLGEVGRAARRGLGEARAQAERSGDALDGMARRAFNLVSSFAGLGGALRLLKELEDQANRVIDARQKLGEFRLTRAEQIQPLVDNLGMNPDAAGQQRTDAVVLKFQEETGATPQQAVEILSMAQANQYPVADPARPEQDAKLPGFAVAAQLGTFARRLRLPAPDAAELFKVARLAGVRDEQGMKEFLARLEAGSKDTPINSPAQYVGGFLKAAASQLEARVPLNEVLAQFAAAAGSTTDASVAATNVKQFERAAAGTDDARTLQLAREAERQGVISPASVARELEEVVRPRLAAEQAPQREADERDRREIADAERNLRQVEEAAGPELAVLADSVSRAKRKPERDRAVLALDAKRREVDERKTGLRQRIADRGSAIRRRAEAADQVEREAALVGAYRGLPLATQMKVLRDATDGMDEQERAKRIRAFADGETWQSIVTQVGTAAKEKYAAVAAGSAAADVAGLEERNRSFRTNTLSQASRAELDAEQLRLQGPAGAEYAAGLSKLADADVARLRAAGSGRVGLAAEMGAVVRRLPRSETDTTEDGLKARRMMVLLRDRVAGFLRSTPAAVRQRHAAAIDASWNRFEAAYQDVVVSDRGADVVGGYAGKDRLRKAQEMAAEFGALRASIQADVRPDEPLPVGDEPGAAQVAPPMPVPATPAPVAPHPTPAVTPSAPPSPVPPAAGSPRAMAEPSLPPAGERPAALPERFASAGASDVGDPLVTAVGEFVLRGRREREGGGPVLPPPAPAADPAAPAAPTDAVAAADGDLADARAELARVEAAGWGKDEDDHAPYFRAHAAATKRVRAAEAKVRDAWAARAAPPVQPPPPPPVPPGPYRKLVEAAAADAKRVEAESAVGTALQAERAERSTWEREQRRETGAAYIPGTLPGDPSHPLRAAIANREGAEARLASLGDAPSVTASAATTVEESRALIAAAGGDRSPGPLMPPPGPATRPTAKDEPAPSEVGPVPSPEPIATTSAGPAPAREASARAFGPPAPGTPLGPPEPNIAEPSTAPPADGPKFVMPTAGGPEGPAAPPPSADDVAVLERAQAAAYGAWRDAAAAGGPSADAAYERYRAARDRHAVAVEVRRRSGADGAAPRAWQGYLDEVGRPGSTPSSRRAASRRYEQAKALAASPTPETPASRDGVATAGEADRLRGRSQELYAAWVEAAQDPRRGAEEVNASYAAYREAKGRADVADAGVRRSGGRGVAAAAWQRYLDVAGDDGAPKSVRDAAADAYRRAKADGAAMTAVAAGPEAPAEGFDWGAWESARRRGRVAGASPGFAVGGDGPAPLEPGFHLTPTAPSPRDPDFERSSAPGPTFGDFAAPRVPAAAAPPAADVALPAAAPAISGAGPAPTPAEAADDGDAAPPGPVAAGRVAPNYGGGGGVTYHISIGTLVTPAGGEFDFAGRLEDLV